MDDSKNSQIEFAAQAHIVSAGASANVKYAEGVMVYDAEGGLMYEASVGGQQFKFTNQALLLSVATSCIM
jgi:hypothetical protein